MSGHVVRKLRRVERQAAGRIGLAQHREFHRVAAGMPGEVDAAGVNAVAEQRLGEIGQGAGAGEAQIEIEVLEILRVTPKCPVAARRAHGSGAKHHRRVNQGPAVAGEQGALDLGVRQRPGAGLDRPARGVHERHRAAERHEARLDAEAGQLPGEAPGGRLVTSPESTRPTLLALIAGARVALALETEELTDPAVVSALLDARARGLAVTLVWPGPATGAGAPFTKLAGAGATVRAAGAPAIHGKVVVADDRTLYLGSVNLTPTSLDDNRELGLLLAQPPTAAEVSQIVAADAAGGAPPAP